MADYQARLATGLSNWAAASDGVASPADQEKALNEALALQRDLDRRLAGRTTYRYERAVVHINLVHGLEQLGRRKEAGDQFRQAVALRDALAAEVPLVARYRSEQAHAHYSLGSFLETTEPAQAEQTYRQALAVCGQLAADFPAAPVQHRTMALVKRQLSHLLGRHGEGDAALTLFREAVGHFEAAAAVNPRHRGYRHDVGIALGQLAGLLTRLKRPAEAEQAYHQAAGVREKLAEEHPAVPGYQSELGQVLNELAISARGRGELDESRRLAGRAIDHQKRRPRDPPRPRTVPAVPAQPLRGAGRRAAAAERAPGRRRRARGAVQAGEYLVGHFPKNRQYRVSLGGDGHMLGALLKRLGQYPAALEADLRTLRVAEDLARDFPDMPAYRRQVAFDQCALARFLTYGPDRKLWDPARALALAGRRSPPTPRAP